MKKNSTREEWEFVGLQVQKRKLEGRDTEVLINGCLISAKKLRNESTRYASQLSRAGEKSGRLFICPR